MAHPRTTEALAARRLAAAQWAAIGPAARAGEGA